MKVYLILIFLITSSEAFSKGRNCFSTHIKDAIEKNKHRKSLYAKLTNGRTKVLSNLLINSERITFVLAKAYDQRAKKYQQKNLPILCLDYIDMNLTPAFSSHLDYPDLRYSEIPKINIKEVKKELKKSLKRNYEEVLVTSERLIEEYKNSGHYNCMVVHVLESIRRAAFLAPHYILSAKMKELNSPKRIISSNIKLQINSLGIWYYLDRKASEFQEEGVRILCQDIPKIDLPTSMEVDSIYN